MSAHATNANPGPSPTTPPANPAAPPPAEPAIALTDPARFLNREAQWLQFNARVLHLAIDDRTPLLERVRFLSIFSSNLDEFFMKRVGGLRRQIEAGVTNIPYEGISPARQIELIRERVLPLIKRKAEVYRQQVLPALREAGVHLLGYEELSAEQRRRVDDWFHANVFPVLTPLAVDPGHRFPFISNLSVSLGVLLRRPGESEPQFARVKVPEVFPAWHQVGGPGGDLRFVLLQDIIKNNLDDLFPGMEIVKVMPFRVTRNADVEADAEDAEDLLDQMQQALRERRFAPVVRLQVASRPNRSMIKFLIEELELRAEDIYETEGLIEFRSLEQIANLDLPQHRYPAWTPIVPPRLRSQEKDIFTIIREGELLVHHPYEAFDVSVERFIEEAAADPSVLCIKQALYRTSGDSPFVHSLIQAAESGKQVAVLVEVRARFDEARNISWARKLEDAGVHVAYGVVGLKTHTKIALVVRREGGGIRCYAHLGTGNYNSRTARLYEDIGLFTCDRAITDDVVDLFNYLTGRSRRQDYRKLLVAPVAMKRQFLEFIERETNLHRPESPGRIIAKMNQLQDQDIIDALYRASQAGVKIDLIVRGFCTLRPGWKRGLTPLHSGGQTPFPGQNIAVCSIVGRFLEHSRIFYFRNGADDPLAGDFYISSADWMYRNLHARVEVACPVKDRLLRKRLWDILQIELADQRLGWDMAPDGSYVLRQPEKGSDPFSDLGTHQALMDLALKVSREIDTAEAV